MRRLHLALIAGFAVCAGCASVPPKALTTAQAIPGRQVDAFTWDFGIIPKNTVVTHEFRFQNSAGRALTVKDVTTSCGCTASKVDKKTLAPGESAMISVSFNNKGYQAETTQFVYVNTDDPENPLVKFTIKAFIE